MPKLNVKRKKGIASTKPFRMILPLIRRSAGATIRVTLPAPTSARPYNHVMGPAGLDQIGRLGRELELVGHLRLGMAGAVFPDEVDEIVGDVPREIVTVVRRDIAMRRPPLETLDYFERSVFLNSV